MPEKTGLQPVRQIAAHELAVEQIRRSLDLGKFRPGERLPAERDLAEMLDVSRNTVRAAVAVLEHEGRVSVRRGRGGGFLVLEPALDRAQLRFDLKRNEAEVRDAFDFRVIVESGAARLAAERRRAADMPRLAKLVRQMGDIVERARHVDSPTHITEFKLLDSAFHLGIAQVSGNDQLVEAVAQVRSRMYLPVSAVFSHIDLNANDHHSEILAAISDKDPDQAAALMTAHINETRDALQALLKL
ncbi:FCD domain-containing protein [Streptomyces sp. NPDC004610]|uniref:FadR/GntR family transcriptional regulator n=1 Tax=unclassified Streptomyces TaxID=2593676 RepID=UPI0033A3A5C4